MMETAKTWWAGRSAREQSLILAAGGLLALVLFWALVVSPVFAARAQAARSYDAAQALYAEIVAGAREAAQLRLSAPRDDNAQADESLRTAASVAARDLGLPLARIQPGEGGSLAFVFDGADPATLFRWLEAVQSRYGAGVASVTLRRNDGAGGVQANVLIVEAR